MTITEPRPARGSRPRAVAAAVLATLVVGTAACAEDSNDDLAVWVSFAPLQYLVEQVGGGEVAVTNLTPDGADPHSVEMSPARVAGLAEADLVVYVGGLLPAADQAIEQTGPDAVVDVLEVATVELDQPAPPPDPGRDPHFWLDPVRFGLAAEMVADALAEVDPAHADDFRSRADALGAELETLDVDYRTQLADCQGATLVTSHEAFGYLAARYGLQQQGISGIDPEVEPSPARVREVGEIVQGTGVRTIFFEHAADESVARRLADDLGVETAVLDPMERPSDPDYLVVMRANLAALVAGLACD